MAFKYKDIYTHTIICIECEQLKKNVYYGDAKKNNYEKL